MGQAPALPATFLTPIHSIRLSHLRRCFHLVWGGLSLVIHIVLGVRSTHFQHTIHRLVQTGILRGFLLPHPSSPTFGLLPLGWCIRCFPTRCRSDPPSSMRASNRHGLWGSILTWCLSGIHRAGPITFGHGLGSDGTLHGFVPSAIHRAGLFSPDPIIHGLHSPTEVCLGIGCA